LQGKYGSSNEKDAALVAFISPNDADWRFSLVKMDYKFDQTSTGVTCPKPLRPISNPKSFHGFQKLP